ncbi:MAG: hypothetical protein RL087_1294, partial [Pseudomonadota bacterium]
APKGTPAAINKQLNEALQRALKDADFVKKQEGLGALIVTDKRVTPEGHKAFVASEIERIRPVFEAAKAFAD